MKAIPIFPQTPESARRTEEYKHQAAQFEREEQESRAAYIQRNGITPEEAYQANFYPYHAFNDID